MPTILPFPKSTSYGEALARAAETRATCIRLGLMKAQDQNELPSVPLPAAPRTPRRPNGRRMLRLTLPMP